MSDDEDEPLFDDDDEQEDQDDDDDDERPELTQDQLKVPGFVLKMQFPR